MIMKVGKLYEFNAASVRRFIVWNFSFNKWVAIDDGQIILCLSEKTTLGGLGPTLNHLENLHIPGFEILVGEHKCFIEFSDLRGDAVKRVGVGGEEGGPQS